MRLIKLPIYWINEETEAFLNLGLESTSLEFDEDIAYINPEHVVEVHMNSEGQTEVRTVSDQGCFWSQLSVEETVKLLTE